MSKKGKTWTVFAVLSILILISSTSIGFFLYNKEKEYNEEYSTQLNLSKESEVKLQAELKEIKGQLALLEDKNKEADEKINSLLDEKDLQEGLRDALKKENSALKDQLDGFNKLKEKLKSDLDEAFAKVAQFQALLKAEQDKSDALKQEAKRLQDEKKAIEARLEDLKSTMKPYDKQDPARQISSEVIAPLEADRKKVELDKIVVNPQDGIRGHILSVDKVAEFIVSNLGIKQGVKPNDILSVYRGEEYLGDVKVTRVQDELSAADIIPPFTSRKVRKNDTVVIKP